MEVVDDNDITTIGDEPIDEMASYETGSAGDYGPIAARGHGASFRWTVRPSGVTAV
jgi:hypothetical protein